MILNSKIELEMLLGKPNCCIICITHRLICPITLTNTLEGVLGESAIMKSCQATISYAEVALHELDGGEDGGHDLWHPLKAAH